MAKAVFLSLPMHGHTNPSLPLVNELVQRGEQITYLSAAPFADKIEATGATYRPYANGFLSDMSGLPERMEQLGWLLMRTTSEILTQELNGMRAEKPDYLIVDSVAPWGQWIGEILNVPVVTSISTFAFNRHVMAYGMKQGVRPKSRKVFLSKLRHIANSLRLRQRIRRRYHVLGPDLMGLMAGRSGCNIVYTSRHFQPCVDTFDNTFHFVGPSIRPRVEPQPFPWASRHKEMIYISLGTLFNADVPFYRLCFEALARLLPRPGPLRLAHRR